MADTGVVAAAAEEADTPADAAPDEPSDAVDAAASGAASRLRQWYLLTPVLVVALVLGIGVRAAADGWLPLGDDGFFALRAHDVFSRHPPLVGTASSASTFSGAPTSHPGPLQFVLLAIPVAVLGVGAGAVVGTALINAAAIGAATWLVARRLGAAAAALLAVAFAGLAWAMGSVLLHDVWGPFAVVLPFGLFVVAVALAAGGDVKALPVVAVAGSLVLQTHVSYVLLVPGLGLVAFVGSILGMRRSGGADAPPPEGFPDDPPRASRHDTLRWIGISLAAALVCWVPPLVQQVRNEPGNLLALFRAAQADSPGTVTVQQALYIVSGTVALPPWWLPPGFERAAPLYSELNPDVTNTVANVGLAVLAVLFGLAFRSAARRHDRLVLAMLATAVIGIVLGFASVLRAPGYGVWAATYTRFLWPLSLLVWFSLGLAATRALLARLARRPAGLGGWPQRVGQAVLPASAVAVVAIAVFAVPHRDNVPANRDSWQETAPPLIDAVMDAVDTLGGPVLVRDHVSRPSYVYGPMLLAEFAEHDVDFLVEGPSLARQVGAHRSPQPGREPVAELSLLPSIDPDLDAELLFFDSGLPAAQDADLLATTLELQEAARTRGPLQLSAEARRFAEEDMPDDAREKLEQLLATEPLSPKVLHQVSALVFGKPILWADGSELDHDLVDRWARYDRASAEGRVAVYLQRLPAG